MKQSHQDLRGINREEKCGILLLIGFACLTFTACAQAPLTMNDSTVQGQQTTATLELQDPAMFFEEVSGTPISGNKLHRSNVSTTVRTLQVNPGTYQITLVYEHLAQPKCWKNGTSTHCWKVRDRGWWLPGVTLIPGTIEWSPEAGKTYTLTRSGSYWSMTETPSWRPWISLAQK